ncbi:secretion protein EspA [Vibrio coralliilyticus]|jgi:secreted effector protein SseB|uniref:Secretion protein EspA n=1 Tax=Vibrio coralliilyticus TaxID=190893 RepID=A0A097QK51_9VIBR|nr:MULTISPECIES: secretion protein EspA [Vibrio]AIU66819.1 secretion protein EspA [Vibrio coralliilyticus]AIW18861.1 secretion protein EspA [Vibrio coralliilyticus]ARC92229.1 secretion protein EspA [Vibrio coralliilyticus]AXN30463.1 secretion protein EspA [Vibrio coralliilyticus]EEX31108.1 EspA family secreted protein [Vibrio coralliilyticus ATCC BAA-450]
MAVNLNDTSGTQGTSIINSQQSEDIKNTIASRGDTVLSGGIAVLYMFMNLLSEMADAKYSQMQKKSEVSRTAQDMANRVDEKVAEAAKEGDKATRQLSPEVINYMRDNGFTVDGKTIDKYLEANGKDLDQGKLKAVKASLETVSNRASDFVSQSQLQLQKLMQTYNVTVSLLNSMQTMLAEMNKSIAQNIR